MRLLQSLFITAFFLFLGVCSSLTLFSQTVELQNEKNYLRMKLKASKNDLEISKQEKFVHMNFFSDELYQEIVKSLNLTTETKKYIKEITYENNSKIILELQDPSIELFTFYKSPLKSYVLDLWENTTEDKKLVETPKIQITKEAKEVLPPKKLPTKANELLEKDLRKINSIPKQAVKIPYKKQDEQTHDFRYGASFLWRYKPLLPKLSMPLEVNNKTPEHFYPIQNRKYKLEDPIEANIQVAIDFYKKEKFGFMNKSLKLFKDKYSQIDKFDDLILYLKGNALLRQYIKNRESEYLNTALSLLEELAETTHDYELKRSVYQYLIHVYYDKDNVLKALESAKKLYVVSTSNFDEELIHFSSKVILNSLSKLRQKNKIESFLKEPIVKKFLKDQDGIAYRINILIDTQDYDEVVIQYEKIKEGLQQPIEASLLFNVAEAYFQVAEYEKAKKHFQDFIKHYSHLGYSYKARLRYALSLDLLNKEYLEVSNAYKEALDLSADPKVRYEAKLRYVGYIYLRNKKRDEVDPEILTLINYSKAEGDHLTDDLKKLLWLVRLRSLIVNQKYNEAITYYSSIPLNVLTYYDREAFEKDFHEALLGKMKNLYLNNQYADVIKNWELYKEINVRYQKKDYTMSYYVGLAYLNLGFTSEFLKMLSVFKNEGKKILVKEYPIWVERDFLQISYENITLKKLYIEKKWNELESLYLSLNIKNNVYLDHKYLTALFNQGKKSLFVKETEKLLLNNEYKKLTKNDFQSLILDYVVSIRDVQKGKYLAKLEAILKDPYITELKELSERLYYILLEEYSTDKVRHASKISNTWDGFKTRYPSSRYFVRAKYIYGSSLLKNLQKERGEKVLQEIIADQSAPSYLKKLSEADLNDLRIEKKI